MKLRHYLLPALTLLWLIGQGARDRFWITGLLFYLPSTLLALALGLACAVLIARRRRRQALAYGALCLLPLFVVTLENRVALSSPELTDSSLRALHWNVARGGLGWEGIQRVIKRANPDLVILSEIRPDMVLAEFPDMQITRAANIAVLSRHRVHIYRDLSNDKLRLFLLRWRTPTRTLRILVTDVPAELRAHRDPMLQYLMAQLEETRADLLFGDLNAPRRSIALSNLPSGYRHAYEAVGSGWSYSWPFPIPFYDLDHSIYGPTIRPLRYELRSSWLSDHRMQVFDFALEGSGRDRHSSLGP